MTIGRSRSRSSFGNVMHHKAGPSVATLAPVEHDGTRPGWDALEALIERLATTRAVFSTTTSRDNWISAYEPGRRMMVETAVRSSWVQIEHVRGCWETFDRLGRIKRGDVLEPGRASAFMMALFAQLPGVREVQKAEPYLVLPAKRGASCS